MGEVSFRMRALLTRAAALFRPGSLDRTLHEEVRTHLELLAADYERGGMTPAQARHAALRAFGGVEPMKERYRDRRGLPWIEDLVRDVRHGSRALRRHPGVAATAIVTLALGIGANTALFAVIDAVLLRPLPVADPDHLRLITVAGPDPTRRESAFSQAVYADVRERVPAFSGVVAFGGLSRMRLTQSGEGDATPVIEPIKTQPVSGNFFSVLGVRPGAGRLLDAADDQPGAVPAAVVSDGFWARRFGRDPSIVGRSIVVNDVAFTIVGVAPRGFAGVEVGVEPELWCPVQMFPRLSGISPDLFNSRQIRSLRLLARLRSGVDPAQAQAQVEAVLETDRADLIARRAAQAGGSLAAAERARLEEGRLRLEPGRAGFTPLRWQFRRPLLVLMSVVVLVLLIACANVANLLLARAAARTNELAVRMSLGSGRARLIRQLLAESALLAVLGGLCGSVVAMVGSRLVATFLEAQNVIIPVSLDLRVLAFTSAASLAAAFIAGVIPAVTATRLDLVNRGARSGVGRPALTIDHALVASQVALSVVVLIVAGLFLRTLVNLQNLNIGIERENLTTVSLDMPPAGQPEARLGAYREMLTHLNNVPGQSAAISVFGMLTGMGWTIRIPGDTSLDEEGAIAFGVLVSSSFFDVTGMRLVAGRAFGPEDEVSPTRVVIVNETLARRFYGGNAVGRRFSTVAGEMVEIVGVTANAIYRNLRDEADAPSPTVYFPALQPPGSTMAQGMRTVQLQIRTTRAAPVERAVREALRRVDPTIVVMDVRSMGTLVDGTIARERLLADLAGWLGFMSLALGAVGLYGVRSYAVNRRVAEFGVRLALGATPRQVAGRVVAEGALIAAIGIVIGLIAAAMVTRVLGSLLFGVTPLDVPTFAGTAALFVAVAIAASYVPARRATRIDPAAALRAE
jgi:predicted permease